MFCSFCNVNGGVVRVVDVQVGVFGYEYIVDFFFFFQYIFYVCRIGCVLFYLVLYFFPLPIMSYGMCV